MKVLLHFLGRALFVTFLVTSAYLKMTAPYHEAQSILSAYSALRSSSPVVSWLPSPE
jgi:hypothetical protein